MHWRLGLAAWLFIALFTKAGTTSAHEWSRLGTVESIVERHTFTLEESKFRNTRDKIFRDGHFYSHQPPLLAALTSPVYWALHTAGLSLSNAESGDVTVFLFVVLTNGVAFAITVMLLHRALVLAGTRSGIATVASAALVTGSWLFPYAIVTNNHGISAMLLALVGYVMLSAEIAGMTTGHAAVLGAALGLMTAFEVLPIVSFVPAAVLYVWMRRDAITPHEMRLAAGWFMAPLLAHALLNVRITGDIVPAGFHTELFQFEGTTFTATELTGSLKHHAVTDVLQYAGAALLWGKGFFTLAPVVAVGLLIGATGWPWWRRARATHLALLLGTGASLMAALLTTNNLGGAAVGFRHATYLVPACLLLMLPLFASTHRLARIAVQVTLAVAMVSAIMLWWYAVPDPWRDLHLPLAAPFAGRPGA